MGALATSIPNAIGGSTPLPGSLTLNVAAAPIDQNSQVGIVSPAMGQNSDGTWNYGTPQQSAPQNAPMPQQGNLPTVQNYATPPNLGVTPGAAAGTGSLTQGTPYPNITTTQEQATATPQFYTDYLNQLASNGTTAAQGAKYIGATPLQTQAFQQVGQNVGNYQPALTNATNLASSVGGTSLADAIGNYGQANIAANLAPQATAGIVGSGQFGSSRGASALGQTLANADLGILAQQQTALQQDQANKIAAANSLGNLATTTQNLGLGDVNALSTLGAQQQTIAQNQQLFPMSQLTAESNLLKGATIPTSTSSSYTGPIPGAYNTSPLAQIAGVGSVLAGTGLGQTLFGSPASTNGQTPATSGLVGSAVSGLGNAAQSIFGNLGTQTTPTTNPTGVPEGAAYNGNGTYTYTDPSSGTQITYNSSGQIVANDPGQAAVNTYDPFASTTSNPVDSNGIPVDYMNYQSGS